MVHKEQVEAIRQWRENPAAACNAVLMVLYQSVEDKSELREALLDFILECNCPDYVQAMAIRKYIWCTEPGCVGDFIVLLDKFSGEMIMNTVHYMREWMELASQYEDMVSVELADRLAELGWENNKTGLVEEIIMESCIMCLAFMKDPRSLELFASANSAVQRVCSRHKASVLWALAVSKSESGGRWADFQELLHNKLY